MVDERLPHGEEAVEVHVLLGQPRSSGAPQRVGGLAEHEHLALGHPDQVADGADQRGLAGPVRAEQAEEGAGRDLEVEVLEREGAVVVSLGEAAKLERWRVFTEHRFDTNDGEILIRDVAGERGSGATLVRRA